jgi:hypothetical protein
MKPDEPIIANRPGAIPQRALCVATVQQKIQYSAAAVQAMRQKGLSALQAGIFC